MKLLVSDHFDFKNGNFMWFNQVVLVTHKRNENVEMKVLRCNHCVKMYACTKDCNLMLHK